MKVEIEVSGRHCHISNQDLEFLFGRGYRLKPLKSISQPGQFAAQETVDIKVGRGMLKNVRIVGPTRQSTYVEISRTESYQLKINPPVVGYKKTASPKAAVPAQIIGPKGSIKRKAIIIAHRHLHCDSKTAKKLKLKDGQLVSVKIAGEKAVTFHQILVRLDPNYALRLHLDTDEGNAAGISGKAKGEIII